MDPETTKALERLKQLRESGDLPEIAYQAAVAALQAKATLSATAGSALSIGTDNIALAERAVHVEGDVQGSVFTGDIYLGPRPANPAEGWRIYREWLLRRAGQLPLRGVDMGASDAASGQNPLSLAQVYVSLDTRTQVKRKKQPQEGQSSQRPPSPDEEETVPLSALSAAAQNRKLVLVGDPGSGKTTFVNHLAHCLAAQALTPDAGWLAHLPGWPAAEATLIPLVVQLRDWAAKLPQSLPHPVEVNHLWQFIADRLTGQKLDFVLEPLAKALEAGQVILLLDGLDEVASVAQRRFVRDAIAVFAERYPKNRYLLTCRVLAYQPPANPATPDNLRLPTHQFPIFELAPFGEEKIMAFIQAWYNELARAGTVTSQDAPGLIQQLQTAIRRPDLWTLAANPLLLTVMALVHSHKGRLPSARALLYEETIDILLWRWEQVKRGGQGDTPLLSRLLAEAGQVEMDLKKVLWRLAFEVHSQSGTNGDVADIGEWQLRKTLATLKEGNLDWAGQIIEVMKMRAGLLLERAPELFTFPHRTFQEYLAGAHLTVMQDFASKAAILAGEGALWREVILLAVGRLIFLQGDLEKPLALVNRLCPGKPGYTEKEWRKTWLAGDALLTCGLQRVQKDEWGVELLERVQERLVLLLQQGALTARERAEVGDVLAQLGDPRPELMTLDGMQFCFIPAGDFWMGSEENEREKPQHLNQHLNYDYYLGRYPVTVAQWQVYVLASGHKPIDDRSLDDPSNRPVRYVTWHEARGFCAWLTGQWQKAGWLPDGWQVRLPSEAEWEKAARGGVKLPETRLSPVLAADMMHRRAFALVDNPEPRRRYPWGEQIEPEQANIQKTGIGTTSVLGCFLGDVSPYGCVEMSGNVNEWMRSLWGESYSKPSFVYPYTSQDGREDETAADRVLRVLRGGSWGDSETWGRCAFRVRGYPVGRDWNGGYLGFRAVVSPSTSGL